jgi:hypothetical protein
MMQSFPAITIQEFAAACKVFEVRCADKLHGTNWLSVHWTGEELLIKQKRIPRAANPKERDTASLDSESEEELEELIEDTTITKSVSSLERLYRVFLMCYRQMNL